MTARSLCPFYPVFILLLVFHSADIHACVGSRPLGMGGAFVAVADDVNSLYWNPAGLGRIRGNNWLRERGNPRLAELTYTRLMNNRDVMRYDDYFAIAAPNAGLMLINERWSRPVSFVIQDDEDAFEEDGRVSRRNTWISAGCGVRMIDEFPFYVGCNLRYRYSKIKYRSESVDTTHSGGAYELDLGMLWEITPELSLGVLSQNLMRGNKWWLNTKSHNLRPGMAWNAGRQISRLSENLELQDIIVAVDVYDALDRFGVRGLHGGVEACVLKLPSHELRLRGGSYFLSSRDRRAFTGGFGYEHGSGLKIDYTVMQWERSDQTDHLATIGWRF